MFNVRSKKDLLFNEKGQGLTEYALIISLIVVITIGSLMLLGDPAILGLYNQIKSALDNI